MTVSSCSAKYLYSKWMHHAGVLVRLSAQNYTVVEGSNFSITVLADRPAGRDFSVLLTSFAMNSTDAASGK